MKVKSYAKINLCLDVLGLDPSGFHKIQTVFHEIPNLYDEIDIGLRDSGGIVIECDNSEVHCGENNTAYKAAQLLQQDINVKILIKKNIPIQSGLGGGSSNAAAVLKALNELLNLNLSLEKLAELGKQIGMDVPFFIYGGTAFGENFGEKITPLSKAKLNFKIIPGEKVETKWAYENLDLSLCGKNAEKTTKLIEALKNGNADGVKKNIHNDFETLIFKKNKKAFLTGTGGTLFCLV